MCQQLKFPLLHGPYRMNHLHLLQRSLLGRLIDHSGAITGYAGASYSFPATIGTGSTATVAIPLSTLVEDDAVFVTVNTSGDDQVSLTAAAVAVDAVAALSTQVSEMMNALKKLIKALTSRVIKIQKKVHA
jgi:hypothetical protein